MAAGSAQQLPPRHALGQDGQLGRAIADFHFHDLRHTGNQLAAEAGATTKELMRRMGHSTVRAAMRYQHSTDRRDREIASEMSHQPARLTHEGARRSERVARAWHARTGQT